MTTTYDKVKRTLADAERDRLQRQWIKIITAKRGYVHSEKG